VTEATNLEPQESDVRDKMGGLRPYSACPMGTASICRFSSAPDIVGDNRVSPGELSPIYRCSVCGHGVTRPAVEDVSAFYQGRESQDYQRADGPLAQTIKKFVFGRQARTLMRQLDTVPRSVIDFGCGSGQFTMAVSDALPDSAAVVALDFFDEPPRNMGRIRYLGFGRLHELGGTADLVTCFHALEHDDDPHLFVERLIALLSPRGTLVFEVPNVDCIWGAIFGARWDNWYLPFHRVHFSRKSLRGLMEHHGLKVILEKNVCVPTMGRSFAFLARRQNNLFFLLLGAAVHPVQWSLEALTVRPSALRIVVRKS
jgi:2-polyprenyl-3-methyl-5-hydroxy-6-metoxy-1,4-benzoquinol methylase